MPKVDRGKGNTASERYLAGLADRTFLNLWSFPNAFNDRGAGPNNDGKELCDLLVVCGDDVIVFSDKAIQWPCDGETNLRWSRWYRRAVEHSIKQLRGAERWLKTHPDRVFLDKRCQSRLPASLPSPERMRVHLIAIALGAQDACSRHYRDEDGSLMVATDLVGSGHTDSSHRAYKPFCFGDVEPNGQFIHVFDETALDLVLREMDTITDFVRYLDQRAEAIRNKRIHMAGSEAEMLAYYLSHADSEGNHIFPIQIGPSGNVATVNLVPGSYASYLQSEACRSKTAADETSYVWDRLITCFSDNVLAGTSITLDGSEPHPQHAERALRGMALETRTMRRALSQAFLGALEEAERQGQDRFARVILPETGAADHECAYVFLIMAFRADWLVAKGYEAYRRIRSGTLRCYGDAILHEHRHLKRVIGIAIDASPRLTGRQGGSEDVMLLERLEWTPEAEREVEKMRAELEILVPGNVKPSSLGTQEYPVPLYGGGGPTAPPPLNRQQRRAARSRARRSR